MNKIISKVAENNKFKLPIIFYDLQSYEQYQYLSKQAQERMQDLKQNDQLQFLDLSIQFYREKDLVEQVADVIRDKSSLQYLSFQTYQTVQINNGINCILDSIGTLTQLKAFNYGIINYSGDDPKNQLIIKNCISQLKELEYFQLRFQYGQLGTHIENLQYISEGIQNLKKLQEIDLRFYNDNFHLCPQGIDYLAKILSELEQLREIKLELQANDFGNNKKSLESLGLLIGQLPQSVQKIELGLACNNINYGLDNQGDLLILNNGIQQLKNIENLDLKLNLEENCQNNNGSKLQKEAVEDILLGEVKDKIKRFEIIL